VKRSGDLNVYWESFPIWSSPYHPLMEDGLLQGACKGRETMLPALTSIAQSARNGQGDYAQAS